MDNSFTFYLYLQRRLLERANKKKQLKDKEAKTYFNHFRISKSLYSVILKELENLGLIKRVNRYVIEIINPKRSIKINQLSKIYHGVGLW